MSKLSRRDFLKLAGITTAAGVIRGEALPPIQSKPREASPLPDPEKANFLVFRIDDEITPEQVNILQAGFKILSNEAAAQAKLNLPEDSNTLGKFDQEIFANRADNLINSFLELQQTYQYFLKKEPQGELRNLAIEEIKKRFYKIALPLSVIQRSMSNNINSKELFKTLYDQYQPLDAEVPLDPLIGEQIYEFIGNEPWFYDFETFVKDGKTLGTYPFTRKFFHQSGIWLEEFAIESGASNQLSYPTTKPEKGKINEADYALEGILESANIEGKIPIDPGVAKDIRTELEKLGLDRSFSNLIVRNAHGEDFLGGAVLVNRTNIEKNADINLFRNAEEMTLEFYQKHKKGVLFVLTHEVFHVLSGKTLLLNTIDKFKVLSQLQTLNLKLNPVFKQKELSDDEITTGQTKNVFESSMLRMANFSEGNRNSYLIQNLMADVNNNVWEVVSTLGIYNHYFDTQLRESISVREYSDTNLNGKYAAAKYSENYFGRKIQQYYAEEQTNLSELDKFVFEELISRFNTTGLYSESVIWYQNSDITSYYSSTLPLLMMYTSMARGDNRFINAIKKDVDNAVISGSITELEGKYKMRKVYLLNKQIIEKNQYKEAVSNSIVEEFLADQFAFSMLDQLTPDINSYFSALKSCQLIQASRDDFVNIINFFKERNLAKKDQTV